MVGRCCRGKPKGQPPFSWGGPSFETTPIFWIWHLFVCSAKGSQQDSRLLGGALVGFGPPRKRNATFSFGVLSKPQEKGVPRNKDMHILHPMNLGCNIHLYSGGLWGRPQQNELLTNLNGRSPNKLGKSRQLSPRHQPSKSAVFWVSQKPYPGPTPLYNMKAFDPNDYNHKPWKEMVCDNTCCLFSCVVFWFPCKLHAKEEQKTLSSFGLFALLVAVGVSRKSEWVVHHTAFSKKKKSAKAVSSLEGIVSSWEGIEASTYTQNKCANVHHSSRSLRSSDLCLSAQNLTTFQQVAYSEETFGWNHGFWLVASV